MRKAKKRFVIDRRTWLRGDENDSMLYRPEDNLMCCLGQIACQLGARKSDIAKVYRPDELGDSKLDWKPTSKTLDSMMGVNDNETIDDAEREKKLMALGRRIGWAIRFVGPRSKPPVVAVEGQ